MRLADEWSREAQQPVRQPLQVGLLPMTRGFYRMLPALSLRLEQHPDSWAASGSAQEWRDFSSLWFRSHHPMFLARPGFGIRRRSKNWRYLPHALPPRGPLELHRNSPLHWHRFAKMIAQPE